MLIGIGEGPREAFENEDRGLLEKSVDELLVRHAMVSRGKGGSYHARPAVREAADVRSADRVLVADDDPAGDELLALPDLREAHTLTKMLA